VTDTNDVSGPLERYLSILEVVLASKQGLTLAELCKVLDLPKPTAHRLVSALRSAKALEVDEEGLKIYRVGARMSRMLQLGRNENALINYCQVVCNELVSELEETCYVVKLTPQSAHTIAVAVTEHGYRMHVGEGAMMPMHAAASSKILLAYQDEPSRRRYLSGPLEKLTPFTITSVRQVLAEIDKARKDGYATCVGEVDPSTKAYAVPVSSPVGVFYSVGVTGPQFRIDKRPMAYWIEHLQRAAQKLERILEMPSLESAELKSLDARRSVQYLQQNAGG
jgi:DNA-binding IclR family transcriptional regulator